MVFNLQVALSYSYSDLSYIKVEKFQRQTIFLEAYIPKETFERIKSLISKEKVHMDIQFQSKLFSNKSNNFSNYILDSEKFYELELEEFSISTDIHNNMLENMDYEIKDINKQLKKILQTTTIQSTILKYVQFIGFLFTILISYILFH